MSHVSGLTNKMVQAEFHLVCVDSTKLTRHMAHQCIVDVFELSGARNPDQQLYDKYSAFVQDDGDVADTGLPLQTWEYGLPGLHDRVPMSTAQAVTSVKYDHEAHHLRFEGHVSTKAPEFLTSKTLAIVIGNRSFLAANICLYMERFGLLRDELIPMLLCTNGMVERKSRTGESYIRCPVYEETFYPGNFDALLAEVRKAKRMNTKELTKFLDERDG